LPEVHPAHEDDAVEATRLLAAPLSPPLLNPQTDITRCTFPFEHLGQHTGSLLRKTSVSNLLEQF
jgi:hypothetical protein